MSEQSQTTGTHLLDDPKLRHLATAMDVNAMAGHFAQHLRVLGAETGLEVKRCSIEDVYYRRAKDCTVLYRLTLRFPSGVQADEWFHGRLVPRPHGSRKVEADATALKHSSPRDDFDLGIPAVSWWEDLDMILRVFPNDLAILTLPNLIDLAFVKRHVEFNLSSFDGFAKGSSGPRDRWHCRDVRYDRVKYAPQSRCVLRYTTTLIGSSNASHDMRFYGKVYTDSRSEDRFRALQIVYEQLAGHARTVSIPRPILHLDVANAFWQEDWNGSSLIDVLADCDWEELFPRIAAAISTFHRTRIDRLPSGPSLDWILAKATMHQARLASLLPEHKVWTGRVIKRLTDVKGTLRQKEIPNVPIHGAFRTEQILIRERELALIDFDDLALGDPLYDVAQFIASLQYLEFSHGLSKESLAKAADAFYSSYTNRVMWACSRRRVAWYVLAFFINKMYYSSKNLAITTVGRLDRIQDTVEQWLEWAGPKTCH